ncbi:GHKL domain-containing protein [Marinobacterium sp. AK62]|uniref:histidine kinase n=1 Tax=Marinobacterium alkalitolerans TaxID=1542925 RepID=A0ABS3Z6N8_9GAMM|nr:ATP-binding protein [Marinobacterium alkalitolerans]MBP0047377.1 GHKL domain-containing protein [Marinobacterium alkalitolerans]
MNTPADNPYKAAYERERAARLKAEQLLEDKSRELYQQNRRLEESYEQLQQQQAALVQNEKLATLGTLTAGVAHEINNPLAYVISNVSAARDYIEAYDQLVRFIQQPEVMGALPAALQEEWARLEQAQDLAFMQEDFPDVIADTQEGLDRVRDIVHSLRSFSRLQEGEREPSDLVDALKSTLRLLHNELKNRVTVELDLDPLPPVRCNLNEINQVFTNLIVNAVHAMEETARPALKLSSRADNGQAVLMFEDNGCGMDEGVLKEIFTPFYTTKPVGEGTGLGLSITWGIIQDHGGEISVDSEPGQGTRFVIRLPLMAE